MYIYNVTINVAEDVHREWLDWMKREHIANVMNTGCFIDSQILKVLHVEDEGHTYSVQYKFLEMADLERYQREFAAELRTHMQNKFADKCLAFRTVLQLID